MNRKKVALLFLVTLIILGITTFVLRREEAVAPTQQDDIRQSSQTPNVAKDEFDKKKYSTEDASSIWVVSNKTRSLNPIDYSPDDLEDVGGNQRLRKQAAAALKQMLLAARNEGLTVTPLSGYRSYDTQVRVYGNEVATYGQAVADTQSAKPGHSEHQTGLAIDVGGGGCGIEDCFGDTAEGKWVAANAYKFGFIIRYVSGKEDITGYRYEPWHIRYVGNELALELRRTGVLTLEEFFGL